MKIMVDNLHREYFQEEGLIEFEGLIPTERLSILKEKLEENSYDLWRRDDSFKKALNLHQLGMIASELLRQKPIRLGFDHYLPPGFEAQAIQEISSIQGTNCGVLINLETGNAMFLKPDTPLPESAIPTLLVTFASENAVYIRQESDPHTHHLKQFGYNFGDRLTHNLNPIIYK